MNSGSLAGDSRLRPSHPPRKCKTTRIRSPAGSRANSRPLIPGSGSSPVATLAAVAWISERREMLMVTFR